MTTTPETIQSTDNIAHILSNLANTARADAVFGQPQEHNGYVVIPCSEVTAGLGMGFGGGPTLQSEQGPQTYGGGSAGGGGASGRPIAAIVISQEGVSVKPIVDVTKVALAGLTTGTFILLQLFQLFRQGRNAKASKTPSLGKLKRAIG